jgi:hypothetical protein
MVPQTSPQRPQQSNRSKITYPEARVVFPVKDPKWHPPSSLSRMGRWTGQVFSAYILRNADEALETAFRWDPSCLHRSHIQCPNSTLYAMVNIHPIFHLRLTAGYRGIARLLTLLRLLPTNDQDPLGSSPKMIARLICPSLLRQRYLSLIPHLELLEGVTL